MKTYAKIFDNQLLLQETTYKEHFFQFLHEFSKTHQRSAELNELQLMMKVFESFSKESSSPGDKKNAAKSFLTNQLCKAVAIKNPLLMRKLFCDQKITLMDSDKEFALNFLKSSLSNPSAFISFFEFDETLFNELTQNLRKEKANLCQSILANRFLYASNDTLDKFLKGDKTIHDIILVLNKDPIDETKLDQLAQTLKQSDSIKLSEDTRINKTILHDKDRIKKFLKGEKIPLTSLQSVTQFLTSHGDYKVELPL